LRINAGEIWAFVEIAGVASQREIGFDVFSAVLTGDHVFNVESEERIGVLVDTAIFAAIAGSLANEVAKFRIHGGW
jgi:hypothetical protein